MLVLPLGGNDLQRFSASWTSTEFSELMQWSGRWESNTSLGSQYSLESMGCKRRWVLRAIFA